VSVSHCPSSLSAWFNKDIIITCKRHQLTWMLHQWTSTNRLHWGTMSKCLCSTKHHTFYCLKDHSTWCAFLSAPDTLNDINLQRLCVIIHQLVFQTSDKLAILFNFKIQLLHWWNSINKNLQLQLEISRLSSFLQECTFWVSQQMWNTPRNLDRLSDISYKIAFCTCFNCDCDVRNGFGKSINMCQ